MKLMTFEQIISQLCFFILFATSSLYWAKLVLSKAKYISNLSRSGIIISNICLAIILFERWVISGHAPLSNLYESSMFLAWNLTLLYLLVQKIIQSDWPGAIIAPSAVLAEGFATFGLPREMQQFTLLVPALQSNWLMMHVSMMIASYGLLLFGSLLAVTLLIVNYNRKFKAQYSNTSIRYNNVLILDHCLEKKIFCVRQYCLVDQLDHWSYRAISVGFPLLTIGILSGAVWANEAWGSYWSWDPKETWAFITWVIFAIYLHARMIKGWNRKKTAFIASLGLFVVWACYLGVNLLGKGLHSYGWFN